VMDGGREGGKQGGREGGGDARGEGERFVARAARRSVVEGLPA
jgi:hypothetical protein